MKKKAQPVFEHHPLARIYAADLFHRFTKERSIIKCPKCGVSLFVFKHPSTNSNAFFLCQECAFFRELAPLKNILYREENDLPQHRPPNAINRELDNLCKSVMPAIRRQRFRYSQLSGVQRCAKR